MFSDSTVDPLSLPAHSAHTAVNTPPSTPPPPLCLPFPSPPPPARHTTTRNCGARSGAILRETRNLREQRSKNKYKHRAPRPAPLPRPKIIPLPQSVNRKGRSTLQGKSEVQVLTLILIRPHHFRHQSRIQNSAEEVIRSDS